MCIGGGYASFAVPRPLMTMRGGYCLTVVTDKVYDGYGELHGGSVGDKMCKPDQPCKGPNPDRLMEGNSYFGMQACVYAPFLPDCSLPAWKRVSPLPLGGQFVFVASDCVHNKLFHYTDKDFPKLTHVDKATLKK